MCVLQYDEFENSLDKEEVLKLYDMHLKSTSN